MAYRHGVYTSEVTTSIQTAAPVDSALPFVVGTAPSEAGPVLVTSWRSFCNTFGVSENVDIGADEYSNGGTLTNFAYYWFVLAGRSDCILQSVAVNDLASEAFSAVDGDESVSVRFATDISGVASAGRDTIRAILAGSTIVVSVSEGVYSVKVVRGDDEYAGTLGSTSAIGDFSVTIGGIPVTFELIGADSATFASGVTTASVQVAEYGAAVDSTASVISAIQNIHTIYERFGRVAPILAAPYLNEIDDSVAAAMATAASNIGGRFKGIALIDMPSGFNTNAGSLGYDELSSHKRSTSEFAVLAWPHVGVGSYRFAASTALAAAFNETDGRFGGLPYVSPSNKALPVTGCYDGDGAVYLTRDDVNAYLGAYGITGFRNTASGWVAWGDNTAAFPGSTDIKDYMIPVRRMFNHVSNTFQLFADSRVSLPLNRRQLDGVINSFNQTLASFVGFGALNAASVELDSDLNTTESLLSGTVYIRIRIAPPPSMVVIEGVLEYDVSGFEQSIA